VTASTLSSEVILLFVLRRYSQLVCCVCGDGQLGFVCFFLESFSNYCAMWHSLSWLSGGMHNHPRITVVLCKVPHPHKHITTGVITLYTTKQNKTHILPCCCGQRAAPLYRSHLASCTSPAALGSVSLV